MRRKVEIKKMNEGPQAGRWGIFINSLNRGSAPTRDAAREAARTLLDADNQHVIEEHEEIAAS